MRRPLRPSVVLRRRLGVGVAMAAFAAAIGAGNVDAAPAAPRLGRPLTAKEVAGLPAGVYSDGRGLPAGSGDARLGKAVFAQHCARCHGAGGRGGSAAELVGGSAALTAPRPDKTIGLFWPSAATLFDFNRRAMPMDKPGSLTPDEAYAVTAYLLAAEGLITDTAVMNRTSLPAVKMPNRNGFRWVDAAQKPAR